MQLNKPQFEFTLATVQPTRQLPNTKANAHCSKRLKLFNCPKLKNGEFSGLKE